MNTSKTALYRHYNDTGELLYVGIAIYFNHRLSQHKKSRWFEEINMVWVEWFDSKHDAALAELKAIQTENPKFNINHKKPTNNFLIPNSYQDALPITSKAKNLTDIRTNELANFLETTPGFAHQIKKGLRKLPPQYCQRVSLHFSIALHDLRPDIYSKNN
jgi:excinuclease UvrABC nuclease subunit